MTQLLKDVLKEVNTEEFQSLVERRKEKASEETELLQQINQLEQFIVQTKNTERKRLFQSIDQSGARGKKRKSLKLEASQTIRAILNPTQNEILEAKNRIEEISLEFFSIRNNMLQFLIKKMNLAESIASFKNIHTLIEEFENLNEEEKSLFLQFNMWLTNNYLIDINSKLYSSFKDISKKIYPSFEQAFSSISNEEFYSFIDTILEINVEILIEVLGQSDAIYERLENISIAEHKASQ